MIQKHYDITGEEFDGVVSFGPEDNPGTLRILCGPQIQKISNVTFTLRVGALTPMAAKELYESLSEAPQAFLEILAQYYFDVTGKDIHDDFV